MSHLHHRHLPATSTRSAMTTFHFCPSSRARHSASSQIIYRTMHVRSHICFHSVRSAVVVRDVTTAACQNPRVFLLLSWNLFPFLLFWFSILVLLVGNIFFDPKPIKPTRPNRRPAQPPPAQTDDTNGWEWVTYSRHRFSSSWFSSSWVFSTWNRPNSPGVQP